MDDETKLVDEALTVRAGSMADWWLIERAKHDGRTWMEPYELAGHRAAQLMLSSRITNADIEGDGGEMLALAKAIRGRGEYRSKRCAVRVVGDRAELCSPRNSLYSASVPLAVADALAEQIEREVKS